MSSKMAANGIRTHVSINQVQRRSLESRTRRSWKQDGFRTLSHRSSVLTENQCFYWWF